MIKCIFFDIDGTLRDFNEYGVRPSVYEAISKARAAGIKCYVSSGRHSEEIRVDNLLGDLEFDGFVYLNGGYCCDNCRNVIYSAPVDPSQVKKALDLLETEPYFLCVMEAERFYINEVSPYVEAMHGIIGTKVPPVNPNMEECLENDIYMMVAYAEDDVLDRVMAQLPLCEPTRWNTSGALDIVPKGIDKCIGVSEVVKYLGLSMDEVAAIGDSFNDIGMLKMVGLGICMGNGQDETKAVADYIAPHIDDDGLLKAVEYIISLNR